jgi:hypothetical protein
VKEILKKIRMNNDNLTRTLMELDTKLSIYDEGEEVDANHF